MLLISKYRNIFGEYISPVLILLIGLSIGLLPLFFYKKSTQQQIKLNSNKPWQLAACIILATFGFFEIYKLCKQIFNNYPISVQISDIIPLLQVMVNRVEHLWYPYKPFSDFGYELFPTYLPAQWAPFVIAQKFHWGYRETATIILFLSLAYLFYYVIKAQALTFIEKLSLIAFPIVGIYTFILYDNINVGVSIEQMIMGYYILLCTTLVMQKNIYIRSFAIVLCLLSRFSLLFWVPIFLYSVYIFEGKKNLKRAVGFLFLSLMIFYILPFLIRDPFIFLKAQKAYTIAALGEWDRKPSPHLQNGLGMAIYFVDFIKGDNLNKLRILQFTMLGLSLITMIILGIFLNKRQERLNIGIFNIASLKIILSIFYAFVQVPYSYLYFVPLGVSAVVLFAAINQKFVIRNS